jgi:hypothetical protein
MQESHYEARTHKMQIACWKITKLSWRANPGVATFCQIDFQFTLILAFASTGCSCRNGAPRRPFHGFLTNKAARLRQIDRYPIEYGHSRALGSKDKDVKSGFSMLQFFQTRPSSAAEV